MACWHQDIKRYFAFFSYLLFLISVLFALNAAKVLRVGSFCLFLLIKVIL
jgi:hypothetical protein